MAQGGLHEVQGRTAIQRVRGMGVPQPVRRDRPAEPGPVGGSLDHPVDLRRAQPATGAALARAEDRRLVRASQRRAASSRQSEAGSSTARVLPPLPKIVT